MCPDMIICFIIQSMKTLYLVSVIKRLWYILVLSCSVFNCYDNLRYVHVENVVYCLHQYREFIFNIFVVFCLLCT